MNVRRRGEGSWSNTRRSVTGDESDVEVSDSSEWDSVSCGGSGCINLSLNS
jgi:hypothetical protein